MSVRSTAAVLAVADVEFGYGGAFRLAPVSFEVAEGEMLGVVGPNSSGKTTLLRLLSKVHAPDARRDPVPGEAARRRGAARPRPRGRGGPAGGGARVLGQRRGAGPDGALPARGGAALRGPGGPRARRARRWRWPGVLELADHPVDALAGGERQRALLARALAQEPRVLLLDEPTSHLDLWHQRHSVGLLRRLNRERGMTVVFVSHDLNLAGGAGRPAAAPLGRARRAARRRRRRSWTRRCSRWRTAARSGWSGSPSPAAPSSSGSDFDFGEFRP